MKPIEKKVYEIVLPYADKNNLEIYDVIYDRQGKDMYLSIYIDKEDGVTIEDCENLTNYINPILDDKIDIKEQYFLEVSSSGLEKVIRNEEHFRKFLNTNIRINTFKPIDKKKEFEGILKKYNEDEIVININKEDYTIERSNIAIIKTVYDWNLEGGNLKNE